MYSNKRNYMFLNSIDQKRIDRRTFFAQSVAYASGITLLVCPGIVTEILASEGEKSKEEILRELETKAEKFMSMYGTCPQSSFAALNEQFELRADRTISALMPFAGGVASKGETCGAVSGSLLAIGFHFEPVNQSEMEKAGSSMKYGSLFFNRFLEEFGSTRCKEVVKHQYGRYYDLDKPEELELFMEASIKSGKCLEVIKKAVFFAGEIILENS